MRDFGKKAATLLLALALSVMMVPATAFADIGGSSYKVEVDASQADASHTTGEDVTADGQPAVGVVASNGHTAEVEVGNVTSSSNGTHAVMAEADSEGTANVTTGNVTEEYGPIGVSANASGGGKTSITVDGDVSGTDAGLFIYCANGGSNDVLVTGTISGKNGVDISYDSVDNDSLTVWKIEKAANGQYVSSEWNHVPSDDRETFAKKRISYIVKMLGSASAEAANLRAAKNLGGAALDQSHGYDVAKEGTKVYLVVDPGYKIAEVTNYDQNQTVLQDADGNYYIVVKRGGGIYLFVTIEGDEEGELYTVIPDAGSIVTGAAGSIVTGARLHGPSDSAPAFNLPYLTNDGVVINEVKLEMDGQIPTLRTTLTNANDHDVNFDCTKFKVVNADDGKEIAFKAKSQELKAGETDVECELKADARAMEAGDRARVYYDGQLLGTFTVE